MSIRGIFDDDLDLQESLLSVVELSNLYENLYRDNKIHWNPKTLKTRAWSFILYPESAPENWLEILDSFHCAFCISPLHDRDVKKDGTSKKPHYHVIYVSDGPCYFKSALSFMSLVKGIMLEPVHHLRGAVRYHIHIDSPEKAQYSQDDIICLAGFDYEDFFVCSDNQYELACKSMLEYIISHGVSEFSDFAVICDSYSPVWSSVLRNRNTLFFDKVLRSVRHSSGRSSYDFLKFAKNYLTEEAYNDLVDLYTCFFQCTIDSIEKDGAQK